MPRSSRAAALNVTSWTTPPPAVVLRAAEDRRRLRLPAHARRHAAVDDRAPAGPGRQGSVPDGDRVLGLLAGRSEVAATEHADRAGARYATVGINMRGTGCSGGAFDYFEQLQSTDGYDAIETIAAQPWVAHHKVGHGRPLVPGHQPAVRRAAPAAAPRRDRAAVGDRRHDQGHARAGRHPQHRASRSRGRRTASTTREPAPGGGQQWATDRIKAGDKTCLANQALHSQAPDVGQDDREPEVLDRRDRPAAVARALRATRSTCPCTSRATGRTSRPAATSPTCSTSSPARRKRGSPRRTAATPIRSTRRCSRAGCSSCRSSSRRRCRTRRALTSLVASTDRQHWRSARPRRCRPIRSRT